MFSKTIILGRLGRDPQLKTTKTGTQMCTFSMAVDTGFGDKKVTDWYSVTVFNKQADACAQFLRKGSTALIEGVVHLRSFEKDGKTTSVLELTANSVTFMPKQSGQQSQQPTQPQQEQSDDNPFVETPDDLPF